MSKYFGLPLATALLHLLNASASCCEPQVCYGSNGLRPIDPDNSTNNKALLHLLNASASCCEPQVLNNGGNGLRPIYLDNSTKQQ